MPLYYIQLQVHPLGRKQCVDCKLNGGVRCVHIQTLLLEGFGTSCQISAQFEHIMKAAQEKIHLEDLLNIYSIDHLAKYQQCPQVLAEELKDIETIGALAQSQFTEIVVDLRKKSLEYDKTFKVCDRLSKQTSIEIRVRRSVSNNNFAYSIHSLSAQSILSQFPQRRILTELKLKFLQSEGVDQHCWEKWFCSEEKILLIKDQKNKFEIKLGVRLTEGNPPALAWEVFDATSSSHHHPQLFYFLQEYSYWMKTHDPEWEFRFISKLQTILSNLSSIFLFLAMRDEIRMRDGEVEQQTLKFAPVKNGSLKYIWNFQIFQHLECPKVTFFINQEKYFEIYLQNGTYKGDIFLNAFNQTIALKHLQPISLQSRTFLFDFSLKLQNYNLILKKFGEKYSILNDSIVIFLIIQGQIWKPESLQLKEQDYSLFTDGIWAQVTAQSGIIIKIDEDMRLTYPQFERGFFNHFLPKLSVSDLLTHIYLRNQIIKHNKEFQFKIYRINYVEATSEFIYEFRSFKYNEHQRIFKITRQQEETNDNFVILLRVAANFEQVSFSAYKFMEGPQNEQKIADSFFPKKWKEYRDKVAQRFDWRKICECITYLCKCYLVERSYNKRMTEDQRKMTVYSFK